MPGDIPDAVTVTEFLDAYEKQGYVMSFRVEDLGQVRCGSCDTSSPAEEVHVDAIARAEGPSDPADMAIVAVVRCPSCQAAGTLVAGYGAMASPEDAEVVSRLRDARSTGEPAVLLDESSE